MPNATLVQSDNVTPLGTPANPITANVQNNISVGQILFAVPPTPSFPVVSASGNQANANAVATLAAAVGKSTYITGFEMTATGATGALIVNATVVGILGGTLTYTFTFPAGVTTAATPLIVAFNPALPSSATNTAIVVTLPAGGSGNTNAACVAHGFQV